jgi:CheY-like chemotaxis protein
MKTTILLIEDNEQNQYLATFLLNSAGHDVEIASDGPVGIKMAAEKNYAMILLDIQLPTMDGYAVARSLRQNPLTATIPIVAVTSYAMTGDREKSLAAGCDGYLRSPSIPRPSCRRLSVF